MSFVQYTGKKLYEKHLSDSPIAFGVVNAASPVRYSFNALPFSPVRITSPTNLVTFYDRFNPTEARTFNVAPFKTPQTVPPPELVVPTPKYASKIFNNNGINVTLVGTEDNVNKAFNILTSHS